MFCVKTCFRLIAAPIAICVILLFASSVNADYPTELRDGKYLQDSFGDINVGAYSVPVVFDWNGDGKKDLLVGQNNDGNGYISFYENVGANDNPVFDDFTYVQSCDPGCSDLNVFAAG